MGCGYCAGTEVDPDDAETLMIEAGLKPLRPYPGSAVPWLCECLKCGHTVTPRHANIRNGASGCRSCAEYGFDPREPGVVYLIGHDHLDSFKIGVMNLASERLEHHENEGWYSIQTWEFKLGQRAEEVEQQVLDWWRDDLEAAESVVYSLMPRGGHTETVSRRVLSASEIIDFVERLKVESAVLSSDQD
jgi:hypothetical protein